MKKHILPDGRTVIIRKFTKIPPAVRREASNKGLAEALAKVGPEEYAELEVGGVDSPTRSINGNVRQFCVDHGVVMVLRDMGNGRVRVYRES